MEDLTLEHEKLKRTQGLVTKLFPEDKLKEIRSGTLIVVFSEFPHANFPRKALRP